MYGLVFGILRFVIYLFSIVGLRGFSLFFSENIIGLELVEFFWEVEVVENIWRERENRFNFGIKCKIGRNFLEIFFGLIFACVYLCFYIVIYIRFAWDFVKKIFFSDKSFVIYIGFWNSLCVFGFCVDLSNFIYVLGELFWGGGWKIIC